MKYYVFYKYGSCSNEGHECLIEEFDIKEDAEYFVSKIKDGCYCETIKIVYGNELPITDQG